MKTIPSQLLAHLQLPAITTCLLTKVECVGTYEGTILGFTNLDIDVTYADDPALVDSNGQPIAIVYQAENGFVARRLAQTSTVSGNQTVDNSELDGVISPSGITEAMVRSGLFDSAKVTIYRVNYEDLTPGRHEIVAYGRAGETTYSESGWRTEFRSLSQLLTQPISQPYSLTCRAQFGDARCKKVFVWTNGTVSAVGAEVDREFEDATLSAADGFYTVGVVQWLTGLNAGAEMEVDVFAVTSAGADFALSLGMPFAIHVGDTYRVRQDCGKTFAEWCRDTHANTDNFRGENLIPVDGTALVPGAEIKRAR
jgi:uncharacterized phage protein (TIGR02218 family)